jgi:hypothetical protein
LLRRLRRSGLLPRQCGVLTRQIFDRRHPFALRGQHLPLLGQRLFGDALRQVHRLLPHGNKGLRNLARKCWQTTLLAQPFCEARPPLVEQTADARRTAAAQLQTYALNRQPFAAGQHRIRGGKHLVFRHSYCHGSPPAILGLIRECYPPLIPKTEISVR